MFLIVQPGSLQIVASFHRFELTDGPSLAVVAVLLVKEIESLGISIWRGRAAEAGRCN